MKTREEALDYGLSFENTYVEAPFHDDNWQLVRYKLNKKAFLWTYEKGGFVNLNVKVDPDKAFFGEKHIQQLFQDIIRTKKTGTRLFLMVQFQIVI